MNILEFVEQGGEVVTSSGHKVSLILSDDEQYPLIGTVDNFGSIGYNYPCKWDKYGFPSSPTMNHSLDLNPTVKETKYRLVNRKKLELYTDITEFFKNE